MKVYGVYTTDFWESTDSIQQQGLFSTIDLARKKIEPLLEQNSSRVIIEEITVDEDDSNVKFEVYDIEGGLEYKADASDAKFGSFNRQERDVKELTNLYVGKKIEFKGNEDFEAFIGIIDSFGIDPCSDVFVVLIDPENQTIDVPIQEVDLLNIEL